MAVLYIRSIPGPLKERLDAWAAKEYRSSSNAAIRLLELALDAVDPERPPLAEPTLPGLVEVE